MVPGAFTNATNPYLFVYVFKLYDLKYVSTESRYLICADYCINDTLRIKCLMPALHLRAFSEASSCLDIFFYVV